MKGYGQTASTYALRAVYTQCPSDFTKDGQQMMCSSEVGAPESEKRYTGCSAEGVCECKAPYQKPLPQVYDGKYPSSAASCTSACHLCAGLYPSLPCISSNMHWATRADSLARSTIWISNTTASLCTRVCAKATDVSDQRVKIQLTASVYPDPCSSLY